MPILFRILYTCGLRVSEARLLKVVDVISLTVPNKEQEQPRPNKVDGCSCFLFRVETEKINCQPDCLAMVRQDAQALPK
jgi:hypothetical protein